MPNLLKKVCSSAAALHSLSKDGELEKEFHQDWSNVFTFEKHATAYVMQLSFSPPSKPSQLHLLIHEKKWVEIGQHFRFKSKKAKGYTTITRLSSKNWDKSSSSNPVAQLLLRDELGRTPLFLMLRRRGSLNAGLVKAPFDLIISILNACPSAAAVPDTKNNYPLHVAVMNGQRKSVVRAIIQCYPGAGMEQNEDLDTPLILAANFSREVQNEGPSSLPNGKPSLIKPSDSPKSYLYAKQDELNDFINQEAFSSSKRWDLVLLLLQHKPEAACIRNRHGMSVLEMALQRHAPSNVIRALIRADKTAVTARHPAVLSSAIPDNLCYKDGVITPLTLAVRREAHEEVLGLLSSSFPDALGLRDEYGLTPLSSCWLQWFYALSLNSGVGICDPVRQAKVAEFFKTYLFDQELLSVWRKIQTLLCVTAQHYSFCNVTCTQKKLADKVNDDNAKNRLTAPLTKESFIVHAAAAQDCPVEILEIAIRLYPSQVKEQGSDGRTPLHLAAGAPIYIKRSYEHDQNSNQIDILSKAYPAGALVFDDRGLLPIHIAIRSGKKWEEGLSSLVAAQPRSLSVPDPLTGLQPALLAACCYSLNDPARSAVIRNVARNRVGLAKWQNLTERQREIMAFQCRDEELSATTSIFELLRSDPTILLSCNRPQNCSNEGIMPSAGYVKRVDGHKANNYWKYEIREVKELKAPCHTWSPTLVSCLIENASF